MYTIKRFDAFTNEFDLIAEIICDIERTLPLEH